MATCCRTRCSCVITAGDNITITGNGNGTLATPYVINAVPSPPVVVAVDSPTVDVGVTGTGITADPYKVTAAVILDPTPPSGGANLIHTGPEGLYLECANVRGCISAGSGASYNAATGVITAKLSGTAGNAVAFGADGGLFVPAGSGTSVTAVDSPSVDVGVTGTGTVADPYAVTAAVILDPTPPEGGSNLIHSNVGGLYVECADVRGCISAGPGATYDPATGIVSAHLSGTAGNATVIGADGGLYTPSSATALTVTDSPSVDLTLTGAGTTASPYNVAAAAILDATPPGGGTNLLHTNAGGLYVECADVRGCISAGPGATYDPATGIVSAHVSGSAGNTVVIGPDGGIYSPQGTTPVTVTDSFSVDLTLTGAGTTASPYNVTAAAILDATPPGGGSNLLHTNPGGLYVECADVRGCISAGPGATYDPATGVVSAHVSGTAGNTLTLGGDGGLLVPAGAGTALTVTDTPSVDLTLTGTGSAASPYAVAAAVILDATPPGGGTNLLHTNAGGLYVECADVRGCISAGPGAAYNPATGVVTAHLSVDAGNGTVIGTDGGLYTPSAATALTVTDTPTVDLTLTGAGTTASPYAVAAAVILDTTPPGGGTNLIQSGPGGLSLECADIRGCISAGDGATYDPATGIVSAHVSATAGNTLTLGTDGGLLVPAGAGTSLTVTDTPSVDLTLTGTGSAASPYAVTAAVILDATPPGGGSNLLHTNAGGLYVECADVRGCISAGPGATYNPATGIVSAHLSTTAGNTTVIGADGGLYTPTPAGTALNVTDSPTVDLTLTGAGTAASPYGVTAAVILAPVPPAGGTNLVHSSATGLYVECADVRGCISAGDGAAYDPASGIVTAHLSGDAGNAVAIGTDGGLFVPPGSGTALTVTDSPTVDLTLTGAGSAASPYAVTAAVILDATPPGGGTNLVHSNAGGLYVECADVRGCISAGPGATYNPATGIVSAHLSTTAGNTTVIGADGGLYTPTPAATALTVTDSPTVDLTVAGAGTAASPYAVTAAVILDATPPGGGTNLLHTNAGGLYVECADVRGCISAGPGATYDPATGIVSAHLSTTAGNTLAIGGDGGLLVPTPAATPLTVTDTQTVDLTLTGAGTAASPYAVTAAVILDATPPGGGTNLLHTNAGGLYVECADVRGCISAGNGAAYTTGTGVVAARLSTDAGNTVTFGTDGGLKVVPAPPVTGCGLDGAGTAADPLVVVPSAAALAWPWPCNVVTESTLHCDPATGKLWTPPDHHSAEDHIYVEHFNGGFATPITNTGGWAVIDPGASQSFAIPANFLGNNCRTWGYVITASGTWDINYTATAAFQLGYVEVKNGNPATVRALWGPITALGAARRTRDNGTVTESNWAIPAGSGNTVTLFPAINVTAGSVTINSWITDATIITTTNTP